MKIPTLKKDSKNFERTITLDGGINTKTSSMIISENEIIECNNVIFEDSFLKSRKGFFTDASKVFDVSSSYERIKTPFKFLSGKYIIDGKECRFGYSVIWDEQSYAFLNTYIVFCDGTRKDLNPILFNRSSENSFFVPKTISLFKAKNKGGCGMYLFCTAENFAVNNYYEDFRIFELDVNMQSWNRFYETDYYIPTVYYNGRGNLFSESAVKDDPIYEKPSELESQNLLTGYFYSYFSTDGSSSSFQLPITELDDTPVVCTVSYKDGSVYNWIISGDEAEANFINTKVKVKCNRKTGLISFTKDEVAYELPVFVKGSINNIKILAHKTISDGVPSVVGSSGIVNYKSKIIAFGNKTTPNKVFTASSNNPLYFPKDSVCEVGISGETVKSINVLEDTLIAFSDSAIYSLKISDGDLMASCELISGENKTFFKPDKISCSLLNFEDGCSCPDSIENIGDKLIFFGKHRLYVMNKTGKFYNISYPVLDLSAKNESNIKNAVSFVYNGFYGICFEDKIYLANIENIVFKNKKANCPIYVWQLPLNTSLVSATDFSGKPIFSFKNSQKIHYLSELSGESDISLTKSGQEYQTIELPITAFFKTSFIDFDKIKIEAVSLEAGAKGNLRIETDSYYSHIDFDVDVNLTNEEYKDKIIKKLTVYPSLKADRASIKVIGETPFYIYKLKFFYR